MNRKLMILGIAFLSSNSVWGSGEGDGVSEKTGAPLVSSQCTQSVSRDIEPRLDRLSEDTSEQWQDMKNSVKG